MAGEQTPTVTISKKKLDDIIAGAAVRDAQGNKIHTTYLRADSPLIGKTIRTITKTATSGLTDTYTITFTDNTTWDYYVTNGKDGTNGAKGEKGDKGDTGDTYASLYHLGAYDSVDTSNADYDLVTRGTGYLDLGELKWEYNGYIFYTSEATNVPWAGLGNTADMVCPIYATHANESLNDNIPNKTISQGSTNSILKIRDDSITSVGALMAVLQGINLHYALATPYTEKVLKNQPLSQLDQAGENWLRGMYEKQLNLFDIYALPSEATIISSSSFRLINNIDTTENIAPYIAWKANTQYTFSYSRTNTSGNFRIEIHYTDGTETMLMGDNNVVITSDSGKTISGLYCDWGTDGGATYNNLMIVEGTHAYPFQPYGGEYMQRIDVEGVKLWENGDITSSFASQSLTLSDMSAYKYIAIVCKWGTGTEWGGYQVFKVTNDFGYTPITMARSGQDGAVTRLFRLYDSTTIGVENAIGPNGNTANNYIIPVAIYGIK